ncbi:OPA3 family protein [Colletotrichum simmondsii]|uniref:OPA3 family protein n=1 Tax=Colletotrichum simmondsii TaxID=703756 RepID=A0A135TLI0_9PEZI|nr:OPA3 family protein [Colletotrichum simmondsii]
MVPLPLFKLAALFVRHISKYGANQIKAQAHDHPKFRAFAARYGQHIHQLNMRLSVALLRNPDAEQRAKEKAEAATVKTKEQVEKEEAKALKAKLAAENAELAKSKTPDSISASATSTSSSSSTSGTSGTSSTSSSSTKERPRFKSVWRRKFRSLPEAKAVDLFADVIGDTFILGVASAIILYEYWKASQKPDQNAERIKALDAKLEELTRREEALSQKEEERTERYQVLEAALKELRDPKTKKPLLPSLQLLPASTETKETQKPTVSAALDTHDIALSISQNHTYRFILLSPKDVGQQTTAQRLDRLNSLDGGCNIAVIFLIGEGFDQCDATQAFMEFKIDSHRSLLKKLDPPLLALPLTSHTELPSILVGIREMLAAKSSSSVSPAQPSADLLLYMAGDNEPLSEHGANLLSELGQSPRAIAALADTEEGKARILDLLGPKDGKAILGFLALGRLALT